MPFHELWMQELTRHVDRGYRRLGTPSAVVQAVLQARWQARDDQTDRHAPTRDDGEDIAGTVIWPPSHDGR